VENSNIFLKVFKLDGPWSCSGCFGEGENLLSRWELSHDSLDVWPISYLAFIAMFQVPADQEEADLVGRPIVHKSAYKQATGKFYIAFTVHFHLVFISIDINKNYKVVYVCAFVDY
jgi:hypothetical protein